MRQLQPVLWTKGVLLTPQHLQAQDRFHEDALAFQLGALTFCPWGFVRLEVDHEALAGGTFVLSAAAGRLADGLLFDAPGADTSPPPKSLDAAWAPDQPSLVVHLAVPEYRPGGRNVSASGEAGQARWRAEEALYRDEVTGLTERPVQLARTNLRLLLDGESLEGYTTLPVARVVRGPAGELALDPTFVPPLLALDASPALAGLAGRLVERLTAKSASLAAGRRQRNQGLADFTIADVAPFWLLYTLNTHFPVLRHLAETRRAHPAVLWEAMLDLAGSLTTFSSTIAPRSLPTYDHLRLGERFGQLEALLNELLETAVPESAISLPLRVVRPSVHAVAVDQDRWLASPHWYLAVSAPMRPAELVHKVLVGCKVGSADAVDTLIRQALPGLELAHSPTPPSAVPLKLDFQYFALRRGGPVWDGIERARNLAVYVPSDLPEARFELVVVLR